MISAMTPQALIQERVAAFMQQDFRSIFHSYHPDAPFFQFFPDCETYLAYAATEIANIFQIDSCQILRMSQQDETAEVLFSQRLIHRGEIFDSVELARCHRVAAGKWLFFAGLRLDALRLPDDLLSCPWEDLLAAGSDLWI